MKAQNSVFLITVLVTCLAGILLPFLLSGGIERNNTIIVPTRVKPLPTSTPSTARALTMEAFATLFFTATNTPVWTSTIPATFTFTIPPHHDNLEHADSHAAIHI
jgi:hypothetical protein